MSESETKRCPHCSEEILAAAKVCKHCGRELVKKTSRLLNGVLIVLAGVVGVWYLGLMIGRFDKGSSRSGSSVNEVYLDTRTGDELERTVRRVIDNAGYSCDSIRQTSRVDPSQAAEFGDAAVLVDCGVDGLYLVAEKGEDLFALKR